jgi:predicted flap endonuclease-1-like 5' DNA nuclease
MEFLQGYWPAVVVAVALLVILALLIFRPRQRVKLTDSAPLRPHMQHPQRTEGRGIAAEAAAAAGDIAGDIIQAPVHRTLEAGVPPDDLCLLKGVGPKFADALHAIGFDNFEQIARLSPVEVERLDARLGTFAGRLTRDRIVEQADYLARGDVDGFEQRFGKL